MDKLIYFATACCLWWECNQWFSQPDVIVAYLVPWKYLECGKSLGLGWLHSLTYIATRWCFLFLNITELVFPTTKFPLYMSLCLHPSPSAEGCCWFIWFCPWVPAFFWFLQLWCTSCAQGEMLSLFIASRNCSSLICFAGVAWLLPWASTTAQIQSFY